MTTSRRHEVPTHLDVEDKLLLGLTARQFLYILVGSSAAYALWDQTAALDQGVRMTAVALTVIVTLAFALVRPGGRALEEWLAAGLFYVASSRRSTWQPREPALEEWRTGAAGWHELAPSLTWAEHETA